jgi:hypothetical protein
MRGSSRRTAATALSIGLLLNGLTAVAVNVATSVLPQGWHRYLWIAWPVAGFLTLAGIPLAVYLQRQGQADREIPPIDGQRAAYCREAVLGQVRLYWIDNVLNKSLHHRALAEVGIEERPDMLLRPWDALLEAPDELPHPVDPATSLSEIIDRHRGLLILGAPGAGKTTMLLTLLEDLLNRAAQDRSVPIPVVFPLARWTGDDEVLERWLAGELAGPLYGVPRDIADYWIANERIIPLLDGLDEIAVERRVTCSHAIDSYRATHRQLPIAVTSRTAEYTVMGLRLAFDAALLIEPLTAAQVGDYLDRLGRPLAGLRAALDGDSALKQLMTSPFWLSVAVQAYEGLPATAIRGAPSLTGLKDRVMEAFAERAVRRKADKDRYPPQETIRWLAFIARGLGQRLGTIFYVEYVDDTWLPPATVRNINRLASLPAVLLIGISTGLVMNALFGVTTGCVTGVAACAVFAVYLPLKTTIWLSGNRYSASRVHFLVVTLADWVYVGLWPSLALGVFGTAAGLVSGALAVAAGSRPYFGVLLLSTVAGAAFGAWLGMLLIAVGNRLRSTESSLRGRPSGAVLHDVVWLSGALVIVFGISAALFTTVADAPLSALTCAVIAATAGYIHTGRQLLGYWLGRLWLTRRGIVPRSLLAFLDVAVARMLVYKVGGGYSFTHRLLLEYFASIDSIDVADHSHYATLAKIDLRPEVLLKSALAEARNGTRPVADALAYLADSIPVSEWLPVAAEIADILETRHLGRTSSETRNLKHDDLLGVLVLMVSASDGETSLATSVRFAKAYLSLLAKAAPPSQITWEQAVVKSLQTARESGHAVWAPRAEAALNDIVQSRTRRQALWTWG